MKRRYYYLLSLVAICASLIAILFVVSTSLWFLRGMLGTSEGLVEFGYGVGGQATQKLLTGAISGMSESLGVSTLDYYRFVYTKDRSQEYVVGIPKITAQFKEEGTLEKSGWSVNRMGWIIVASRPVNSSIERSIASNSKRDISFISGFQAESIAVFIKGLPVDPIVIGGSISGLASLDTNVKMYATEKNSVIHLIIEYDGTDIHGISQKNSSTEHMSDTSMFVSIQSDILKKINNQFELSVNANIAKNAHFIKTSPDFISQLPDDSSASFLVDAGQWAVGVSNHGELFKDSIVSFMKNEQGARHLVRRGFQLPDGTIGHEYIASSPTIEFSPIDSKSGCEKSIGYDEQFFLCSSEDKIAFSLNQNVAEDLVHAMSASGQVVKGDLQASTIENIFPGTNITSLQFLGDAQHMDIWVNL